MADSSASRGSTAFPVLDRDAAPRVELSDHHEFDGRLLSRDDEAAVVMSCEFGPGGHADEHVHDDLTHLIVVTAGELTVAGGAETTTVGAGQAVRIDAGIPHHVTNTGAGTTRYLAVSLRDATSAGVAGGSEDARS